MDFRKVIKESLSMLEKSDQEIIFQDINNQVVHVADAAFYGKEVFPKDLIQILKTNFAMTGFPIDEPQFRNEVKELLDKYESALAQKPMKNKLVLEQDFGKIM